MVVTTVLAVDPVHRTGGGGPPCLLLSVDPWLLCDPAHHMCSLLLCPSWGFRVFLYQVLPSGLLLFWTVAWSLQAHPWLGVRSAEREAFYDDDAPPAGGMLFGVSGLLLLLLL